MHKVEMKYFSFAEMITTDTGLKNIPNWEQIQNLQTLITKILDPLREAVGMPITVTSGYRSPALNGAVGGAKNSQHLRGEAADITCGSKEKNKLLYQKIQELGLPYDQLIDEKDYKWIHVSCSSRDRRELLHLL